MGCAIQSTGTNTAAAKTALSVIASTTVRPRVTDFTLWTTTAPTSDAGVEVQAKRFTADGTGTAVTPQLTDTANPAAIATSKSNYSAEPTYTAGAIVKDVAFNPRATHRWVAYDQRAEIIVPATAGAGLGFLINALGGAVTVGVDLAWTE